MGREFIHFLGSKLDSLMFAIAYNRYAALRYITAIG
jgi:hypothetical protein